MEHPSIKKNGRKYLLRILDGVVKDFSLPKYRKELEEASGYEDLLSITDAAHVNHLDKSKETSKLGKFLHEYGAALNKVTEAPWWRRIFPKDKKSIEEVKLAIQILPQDDQQLLKDYNKLVENAQKMRQESLEKQLVAGRQIILWEIVLAQNGFDRFISESDVLNFFSKTDRGVRLDYVANYCKTIPADVSEKKFNADELHIFDNYAVMHYDPSVEAFSMSESDEKAVAKHRDPILFGLIDGSKKLYFIGDWITSEDDLTLDKIMMTLERPKERQEKLKASMEEVIASLPQMLEGIRRVE